MIEIIQLTKTLTLCKSLYPADFAHLRENVEIDVLNDIERLAESDAEKIIELLEDEFGSIKTLAKTMSADELAVLIAALLVRLDIMREHEKLVEILRKRKSKRRRNKNASADTLLAFFISLSIDISKFVSHLICSTSHELARNISMRIEFAENNVELDSKLEP